MQKLSGYLLVISPPEDVKTYVNRLKSEFYKKYGPYDGKYSKPHITICSFPLLQERLENVYTTLQKELTKIEPFILKLNGFGSFTNSNVIFIDIENSTELELLRKKFIYMNAGLHLGKKFALIKNHHLTIGKNITPNIFESAKSDYLSRSYQNSFIVDQLKVLRYDLDAKRYFDFGDLKLGG